MNRNLLELDVNGTIAAAKRELQYKDQRHHDIARQVYNCDHYGLESKYQLAAEYLQSIGCINAYNKGLFLYNEYKRECEEITKQQQKEREVSDDKAKIRNLENMVVELENKIKKIMEHCFASGNVCSESLNTK